MKKLLETESLPNVCILFQQKKKKKKNQEQFVCLMFRVLRSLYHLYLLHLLLISWEHSSTELYTWTYQLELIYIGSVRTLDAIWKACRGRWMIRTNHERERKKIQENSRCRRNLIIYICQPSRVFANGPGNLGSIPGRVIPKSLKMVLETSLLNTQQYKVSIKGKVEQSRKRSSALPYTSA